MNQPLNPVLKTPLSKFEKPRKERQRPERLERLSMPESFALIEWLKAYKIQPGDSVKTMAVAAASALGNSKINENHVRQRMEEFGLPFPTRLSVKAISLAEQLAKLEAVLNVVVDEQARVCNDRGIGVHPTLQTYINERALARR